MRLREPLTFLKLRKSRLVDPKHPIRVNIMHLILFHFVFQIWLIHKKQISHKWNTMQSIHRLYLTIAKWISLSTVSECISGYQPTKMALVISTINTIGNMKSQQGKQYSRLGTDLVLVQNKRNHPLSNGSLVLRLLVYTVRLVPFGCGAILLKSHNWKK